jgi:hypothetical protein
MGGKLEVMRQLPNCALIPRAAGSRGGGRNLHAALSALGHVLLRHCLRLSGE